MSTDFEPGSMTYAGPKSFLFYFLLLLLKYSAMVSFPPNSSTMFYLYHSLDVDVGCISFSPLHH